MADTTSEYRRDSELCRGSENGTATRRAAQPEGRARQTERNPVKAPVLSAGNLRSATVVGVVFGPLAGGFIARLQMIQSRNRALDIHPELNNGKCWSACPPPPTA